MEQKRLQIGKCSVYPLLNIVTRFSVSTVGQDFASLLQRPLLVADPIGVEAELQQQLLALAAFRVSSEPVLRFWLSFDSSLWNSFCS